MATSEQSSNRTKAGAPETVLIYTDGGCHGNPGPGGYGVVLLREDHREELSGGFALTTNNRMEITAAIAGLESIERPSDVTLYSDSKYLVDAVEKGWAEKWRAKGWWRTKKEPAKNIDLWEHLLELCRRHKVKFRWVKGHAGDEENERCDELANLAMRQKGLPDDEGYVKPRRLEKRKANQSGLFS